MILSYLDGANALKLWGLLIQGVYPGNPGHVPVYTDQWRVLSWLRNLLMQGDIEINSDLIAVKSKLIHRTARQPGKTRV